MKTLSIWKPVYKQLCRAGQGLRSFWRVNKFDFFPTEKNLLTSLWYDYAHFRRVCPKDTVYDFLDTRRHNLEARVESEHKDKMSTILSGVLLRGLNRARIVELCIAYLESSSPDEYYRPLLEAVRSEWRRTEGEQTEAKDEPTPKDKASGVQGGLGL